MVAEIQPHADAPIEHGLRANPAVRADSAELLALLVTHPESSGKSHGAERLLRRDW